MAIRTHLTAVQRQREQGSCGIAVGFIEFHVNLTTGKGCMLPALTAGRFERCAAG
jgi:hypothetical protein